MATLLFYFVEFEISNNDVFCDLFANLLFLIEILKDEVFRKLY